MSFSPPSKPANKRRALRPGPPNGELHWRSKLTTDQVDHVRDLNAPPYSFGYGKLAKLFGVSKSCIRDIVKDRRRSLG